MLLRRSDKRSKRRLTTQFAQIVSTLTVGTGGELEEGCLLGKLGNQAQHGPCSRIKFHRSKRHKKANALSLSIPLPHPVSLQSILPLRPQLQHPPHLLQYSQNSARYYVHQIPRHKRHFQTHMTNHHRHKNSVSVRLFILAYSQCKWLIHRLAKGVSTCRFG